MGLGDVVSAIGGAVKDAADWGVDAAGAALGWGADHAGDLFPFLPSGGGGYSAGAGGLPYGATTNVFCGDGDAGSGCSVSRRRFEIEGDFLLDTYEGRVWRYDSDSGTFERVIRELSETELDVVESALGIFGQVRTKFAERIKGQSEDGSASLIRALDVAAEAGKRDIAAYRKVLAARASKAKRR